MNSIMFRVRRVLRPNLLRGVFVTAIAVLTLSASLRAQFFFEIPVFDASNFLEDLEQVFNLAQQVTNMLFQARALPVDMASRYHATLPLWALNSLTSAFPAAGPVISALNSGDIFGNGYRSIVDPLDIPNDIVARMPVALQRRLIDEYATIQMADSVATSTIDQNGAARITGNPLLQILQVMEADAFRPDAGFNSQTALLNKINSASVVELREQERANQFLSSALEQLVVDNKRKRDAEATLMNATIAQWRFGPDYARDLFSRTASGIDTWHLR